MPIFFAATRVDNFPFMSNTVAPLTADERSQIVAANGDMEMFFDGWTPRKRSLFKRGIASRGSWVATV